MSNAGIQAHNPKNTSLLPLPLDQGSRLAYIILAVKSFCMNRTYTMVGRWVGK